MKFTDKAKNILSILDPYKEPKIEFKINNKLKNSLFSNKNIPYMELTDKEKQILSLALEQLEKFYEEREKTCRDFKWICHEHLPQAGDGYVENKNVFDIQDKTIADIQQAKKEARETIMKLINK